MKYTHFEITNFKGIEKIRLDFNKSPKGNIYTLVGLNESGKTTILEAINFLTYREDLDPLDLPGQTKKDIHDLIPISKRSNFNDKIIIKAGFTPNAYDEKEIRDYIEELGFTSSEPIGDFEITQSYQFVNSKVSDGQPTITWSINLKAKKKKQRYFRKIPREEWLKVIKKIRGLLPRVLYFPNFLFEFPDKIYLEDPQSDQEKHKFYRTILQDVLDAIGGNIDLDNHVLERAKSSESFDKKSLESVLLKMGAHITETVFKNWNRIFKKSLSNKEIVVDIDKDALGKFFLRLRLKEGSDIFTISERSLGFRWFFAFLLLTQYRGFRNIEPSNLLFLLDEPASNLHPSAQSQLLESFNNLPNGCSIVYTTHSHHMINPEWLEGTFVVKNEGLEYEGTENEYSSRKTIITLHRYREFASKHPEQSTYFQPILDVLDYSPSKLENLSNVLMLEGKNDFYTINYMAFNLNVNKNFNLLPGSGAGSLTDVIRLYIAWGKNFIIILDSDTEGTKQKERYENIFESLVKNKIYTLENIDSNWKDAGMESLFMENEKLDIQRKAYPNESGFHKTHFNRALQELFLNKDRIQISEETKSNFNKIFQFCSAQLY